MEEDSDHKSPLLDSPGLKLSGSCRLSRRNSVNTLRNDFVSRFPEKVRSVVDVENLYDIDLSKTSGLTKGEKEYYEKQFATLKSFEEVDRLMESDLPVEDEGERSQQEMAMKISNIANIILLALKVYATIKSGSLAIAASTLDSLLDLLLVEYFGSLICP
ncbi:Metal tolerance protein 4 [Ancistrocladus abbreviatus]